MPEPPQLPHNPVREGDANIDAIAHGDGRRGQGHGQGRGRGHDHDIIPTTILQPIHQEDLDNDSLWSRGSDVAFDEATESLDGDANSELKDDWILDDLVALGIDTIGPMFQPEAFDSKYAEHMWHCMSWKMKPTPFVDPMLGLENMPAYIKKRV